MPFGQVIAWQAGTVSKLRVVLAEQKEAWDSSEREQIEGFPEILRFKNDIY